MTTDEHRREIRSAFRETRNALNRFETACDWALKVSRLNSPDSLSQAIQSVQAELTKYTQANEELRKVLAGLSDALETVK